MTKFGARAKELRVRAGKTLREVADHLGVKVSYLSDVEHGRKKPFTPDVLNKFVGMIECGADDLQRLAAKERDSIEIPLMKGAGKVNELAFALARSIDSGMDEAQVDAMLDMLKKEKK